MLPLDECFSEFYIVSSFEAGIADAITSFKWRKIFTLQILRKIVISYNYSFYQLRIYHKLIFLNFSNILIDLKTYIAPLGLEGCNSHFTK